MTSFRWAVRWLIIGFVPLACAWQGEQPRFRAQSNAVVVDVVVTDSKGKPALDLTRDDFQLFEENEPQKITGFEAPSNSALPPAIIQTTPSATPAAPVQTPALKLAPRFITLVLNRADLQPEGLRRAVQAATEYVEGITASGDFISVYAIGAGLETIVPFTPDRARVLEGLGGLASGTAKGISTAQGRAQTQQEIRRLAQQETQESNPALADLLRTQRLIVQNAMWMQSGFQAKALFVALRAIAQACAPLPGRKTLILFSEGFPHAEEAAISLSAVIDSANRANVTMHVVDPSGLSAQGPSTLFSADQSTNNVTPSRNNNVGRTRRNAPDSVNEQMTQVAQMAPGDVHGGASKFDWAKHLGLDADRDDLSAIATQTGGLFVKDQNRILPALEQIDRDLRDTYTLVYQPLGDRYDGSFRKIQVAVSRKGYRVRHRKGFWAIPPGEEVKVTPAAAQLLAMASNGTLRPRFAPKLNGALLFGPGGDIALPISIWLPGELSSLTKSDKTYFSDVTLVLTARDKQGNLLDVTQQSIRLRIAKEQAAQFQSAGVRVFSGLTLPRLEPVDVQAVLQYSGGATAMATYHAPIAAIDGVRTTTLLLTESVGPLETPAAGEHAALEALRVERAQFALPPRNEFTRTSTLTLYFGVEGISLSQPASDIDIRLTLKNGGKVIRELPAPSLFSSAKFEGKLLCLIQFGLNELAAGDYSVEAVVKDNRRNTTAQQTAAFRVL